MVKSQKLVCINGVKKERRWNIGRYEIGEVDEYKYLGVTVKECLNKGLRVWGTKWWSSIRSNSMY